MTRTLFLLNVLALAVLAGLILQPNSATRPDLPQATYDTAAGKAPALFQPSRRVAF